MTNKHHQRSGISPPTDLFLGKDQRIGLMR
jgi:hypothetical protein